MSDELFHYGVKGMKWGKRRSKAQLAAGYSKGQYQSDVTLRGKKTANRINKRVAKGESVRDARKNQARRDRNVALATAAGATAISVFGPQILMASAKGLSKAVPAADSALRGVERLYEREGMRRGMKKANDILSDSRGLTSYQTISLAFDATNGKWG